MKACFNQSTAHSLKRTINAGLKIVWINERVGREGMEREREKERGRKENKEEDEAEESSIRFRRAMMKSIIASWNRSTISADVTYQ